MKLAILTLPVNYNYGGIMQAYALCHVLTDLGHNTEVLDVPRRGKDKISWRRRFHRFVKKYVLRKKISPLLLEQKFRSDSVIMQYTWQFIDRNIPTRIIRDFSDLKEDDYDGYVVGSDQVWRPCYFKGDFKSSITNAYLGFTHKWNVKRIGYAISLGIDKWEYSAEETKQCRELVKSFDAISVREESAISLLMQYLGIEPLLVLDPTMLISAKEYVSRLNLGKVNGREGNLFCYMLDRNDLTTKVISELQTRDADLIPFSCSGVAEDENAPIEARIQPPVEEWLRSFMDAKAVLTDSFHACVFSIIFGKQFYVLVNEGRGLARIQSLLKMFEIPDRIIDSRTYTNLPADYDVAIVQHKLDSLRQKSVQYLIDSLHE